MRPDRDTELPWVNAFTLTRRSLLKRAVAAGGIVAMAGASPPLAGARKVQQVEGTPAQEANAALALARILNPTRFENLPPVAVEHAKMIIASTLASAAAGSLIGSARIVRELAKEHAGRPEATVWFDGARLPAHEVARVNAIRCRRVG